jgi:prolyl-tRNA synthetase
MAGERAYEFLMPSAIGDATVVTCPKCGYRANREVAKGKKKRAEPTDSGQGEFARVQTPGCTTIEQVSAFLKTDRSRIAKSLIYRLASGFVMAVVRGDHEICTEKLSRVMKQPVLGLADRGELAELGLPLGYVSPVGMGGRIPVVVDAIVASSPNLVYGGNEDGIHLLNVNLGRDYNCDSVSDITLIGKGDGCLQCGAQLDEFQAIELGHIFKLGEYYSRAMGLTLHGESGEKVFPNMGSYGIGIGRLIASMVEANNDDQGIVWPTGVAPYRAYLMGIGKSLAVAKLAEEIHASAPDEILFDDRDESPGVKFRDADLIGIPLRIVISPRHLPNAEVEIRERGNGATRVVPLNTLPQELAGKESEEVNYAV